MKKNYRVQEYILEKLLEKLEENAKVQRQSNYGLGIEAMTKAFIKKTKKSGYIS